MPGNGVAGLDWPDFKAFCVDRNLSMQWVVIKDLYWLKAFDGPYRAECIIRKAKGEDQPSADQVDFETNFKDVTNKKLLPGDTDKAPLTRLKIAQLGAKAMLDSIEVETSKLDSLYYKNYDLTNVGFATIKFYDANDVELTTQQDIDSNCVKTVVDYEPTNNYEIIGGKGIILEIPTTDLRVWVVGAPDIPAAYGGSVQFLRGGLNMRYHKEFHHDGRVPKFMEYNATDHRSKFRFIFRHEIGSKHKFQIELEIYNP